MVARWVPPVLAALVMEYEADLDLCPICKIPLLDDTRPVLQSYGGCDHIHHEHCLQQAIIHAHNAGNSHVMCAKCGELYWVDTNLADRGISLHREYVDDILYNGKCIENRSTHWASGYYWLRSTMEDGDWYCMPGRIVGLVLLHEPVDFDDDDTTDEEKKWIQEEYSYHHPITLLYKLPTPIKWTPKRGAQTRFIVYPDLLRQLIRY